MSTYLNGPEEPTIGEETDIELSNGKGDDE
jgi:hypothetical protein